MVKVDEEQAKRISRVRTLQKLFERLRTSSGDGETEFVGAYTKDNLMIFESFVRRLAGQHLPQHHTVTTIQTLISHSL